MKLTLTARPISKKNSKRLVGGARKFIISSKAFMTFEAAAIEELRPQLKGHTAFDVPLAVSYYFDCKGKLDADVDNLIAGVNDVMQEAGVFLDDKQIVAGTFVKRGGAKEWFTTIIVEPAKLVVDKDATTLL